MSWVMLEGEDLERMKDRLDLPVRPNEVGVSVREASFYREGSLVKFEDEQATALFVAAGTGPIASRELHPLEEGLTVLRDVNRQAKFHLPDADAAEDYLRFFCSRMHTNSGLPFTIVDALQPGWEVEGIGAVAVTPLKVFPAARYGDFTAQGFMEHGGRLFETDLHIHADGRVEMTDDWHIGPLVRRLAA